MSERPTPETDAAWRQFIIEGSAVSTLRPVSEQLERQRDEARELARELRELVSDSFSYPAGWWSRAAALLTKAKEVLQ
jgi:hypothetical protein